MNENQERCVVHNVFHPLSPSCETASSLEKKKLADPKEEHRIVEGSMRPYFNNAHMPRIISRDNIPVTFADEVVGTASVDQDGYLTITMAETDIAKRLHQMFTSDAMDHISLDSSFRPAEPG